MTREETLKKAKELKQYSEDFDSITFEDGDTEFFEYVTKELERTAPEVPVQKSVVRLTLNDEVITEYIIDINKGKNKYEEIVRDICGNRLIGFKSKKEDTQLIAKIIETLAGEDSLSISHAQGILADTQMILPMIVTI